MKYAYLSSIEESAFLSCIAAPTEEQIAVIVESLARSDSPLAPWVSDPQAWVKQRFAELDWYGDLEDPAQWEVAIYGLVHRPEFDFQYPHPEYTLMPEVVDWFKLAFTLIDEPAILRRFKPYRYFLSEDRELELFYWPSHAMLDNGAVGRLLGELARFDVILETLERDDPGFQERCQRSIQAARESIAVSIPVLEEIHTRRRMLFAPFEE